MISVDEVSWAVLPRARTWSIPFASCYAYSPADLCAASRRLRVSVKAGHVRSLLDLAIQADVPFPGTLMRFFPADAILVPVPGSTPLRTGRESATGRLALALMRRGMGTRVWFGLRRLRAVRKSGTAVPGSRPSVQAHFDTMAVDALGTAPAFLVLVDDVVTKGRTLLAAALRLREVFPNAEIRGFALLRTLGYARLVGEPLMPCTGTIEWKCEDAWRNP